LKAEKINQMLKQVQHDMTVWSCSFCHPELVSGSRFLGLEFLSEALSVSAYPALAGRGTCRSNRGDGQLKMQAPHCGTKVK